MYFSVLRFVEWVEGIHVFKVWIFLGWKFGIIKYSCTILGIIKILSVFWEITIFLIFIHFFVEILRFHIITINLLNSFFKINVIIIILNAPGIILMLDLALIILCSRLHKDIKILLFYWTEQKPGWTIQKLVLKYHLLLIIFSFINTVSTINLLRVLHWAVVNLLWSLMEKAVYSDRVIIWGVLLLNETALSILMGKHLIFKFFIFNCLIEYFFGNLSLKYI